MTLDFIKDQRITKVNLCTIQKSGGNQGKVTFNYFGITDEQLIFNLAPKLFKHIKEVSPINWCPTKKEESISQFLSKLLFTIKRKDGHKKLLEEDNAVIHISVSLLNYLIN